MNAREYCLLVGSVFLAAEAPTWANAALALLWLSVAVALRFERVRALLSEPE